MAFIDLTEFEVTSEDSNEAMSKLTDTDTIADESTTNDYAKRVPTKEGSTKGPTNDFYKQGDDVQDAGTKPASFFGFKHNGL